MCTSTGTVYRVRGLRVRPTENEINVLLAQSIILALSAFRDKMGVRPFSMTLLCRLGSRTSSSGV